MPYIILPCHYDIPDNLIMILIIIMNIIMNIIINIDTHINRILIITIIKILLIMMIIIRADAEDRSAENGEVRERDT